MHGLPSSFYNAVKSAVKAVGSYYYTESIMYHLRYTYRLERKISQYPFPYKYILPSKEDLTYEASVATFCRIVVERLAIFDRHRERLIRIKKMIVERYRSQLCIGQIIARNVRDSLPDKIITITYHRIRDSYFEAAFSGRFPADMEGDKYVIRVNRLKTSQRAIEVYCASRGKGKSPIFHYLDEFTDNLDRFEKAYGELDVLGEIFMDDVFAEKVNSFLMDYMNQTLYNLNGANSLTRLQMFLQKNRVLAEYIWKANFATKEQRGILGAALHISNRNKAGFQNAENLDDLQSFIERKLSMGKTALDDLPLKIWDKIQKAKEAHESAKKGVRVGLYGRYISSDEIERTRTLLAQAWSEADKWLGQKNRQTM